MSVHKINRKDKVLMQVVIVVKLPATKIRGAKYAIGEIETTAPTHSNVKKTISGRGIRMKSIVTGHNALTHALPHDLVHLKEPDFTFFSYSLSASVKR